MIEPIWKLLPLSTIHSTHVVWREWSNGKQESCLVTTPEYLAWIAEGNTPISSDSE